MKIVAIIFLPLLIFVSSATLICNGPNGNGGTDTNSDTDHDIPTSTRRSPTDTPPPPQSDNSSESDNVANITMLNTSVQPSRPGDHFIAIGLGGKPDAACRPLSGAEGVSARLMLWNHSLVPICELYVWQSDGGRGSNLLSDSLASDHRIELTQFYNKPAGYYFELVDCQGNQFNHQVNCLADGMVVEWDIYVSSNIAIYVGGGILGDERLQRSLWSSVEWEEIARNSLSTNNFSLFGISFESRREEDLQNYPYDPEQAAMLLQEYGIEKVKIIIFLPPRDRPLGSFVEAVVERYWNQIGVYAELIIEPDAFEKARTVMATGESVILITRR